MSLPAPPRPPNMPWPGMDEFRMAEASDDLGRIVLGDHGSSIGFTFTTPAPDGLSDAHLIPPTSADAAPRTIASPGLSSEQQPGGVLTAPNALGLDRSPEDTRAGAYLGRSLPATGLAFSKGYVSAGSDEVAINGTGAVVAGLGIRGNGRIPTADLLLPPNASPITLAQTVADGDVAEAQTPLARASELFASFSPFDRASVEQALDQFLGRLSDLDLELIHLSDSTTMGPWIMTSAALLSIAEVLRRRVRHKGLPRLGSLDNDEDPSLLGLPGVPGRWDSEGS